MIMECMNLQKVIEELSYYAGFVKEAEVDAAAEAIVGAKKIFVAGAGRSGFAARGFANRLMHLGFDTSFVGEPTTPPIKAGDLLIVGSGSGTTASLVSMAQKAKEQGAKLLTVTIAPESKIGSMADAVICLPGTTRQLEGDSREKTGSIQPVGSMFEQLSWLVYDSMVMTLLDKTSQTFEDLLERHGNME